MKAWCVTDRKGFSDFVVVVFAETRGKAISSALGTDEFPKYEWDYTDLFARREPSLDGSYRGAWRMEWDNDEDCLAMVRDAGFYCNEDAFDPAFCETCAGSDYCTRYEEYLEEEHEGR